MQVLVTGGARRIGAAIVRYLAGAGHDVAIHHHHSAQDAETLATELHGRGARAAVVAGDLADPDTPARLVAEAGIALGSPVTGLVNNASLFAFDRPEWQDRDLLDRCMAINLAAPVALTAALAAQGRGGAVVNLLDQKVANLNPDFFSYTCSRVALEGATTMLAQAFAPQVRVNAVSPGLTMPSGDQGKAEFDAVARFNLLERRVAVDDIAATVTHLLTTASITGQNVFVDCGQRFLARDGDVMFSNRARPHD